MSAHEINRVIDPTEYPAPIQPVVTVLRELGLRNVEGSSSLATSKAQVDELKISDLRRLQRSFTDCLQSSNDFPGKEIILREFNELSAFFDGVDYALKHAKVSLETE